MDESELARFLADAAAEAAATERSHERTLRQVAEEEATFSGIALDLAERRTNVIARTTSGRAHRGSIVAVGRDFVVIRDTNGPPVFLALAAISVLRPEPAASATPPPLDSSGSRRPPLGVGLAGVLSRLAAERPRLQLTSAGDTEPLAGRLRSAGADVATLVLDGDRGLTAHFRIAGLADVVLFDY